MVKLIENKCMTIDAEVLVLRVIVRHSLYLRVKVHRVVQSLYQLWKLVQKAKSCSLVNDLSFSSCAVPFAYYEVTILER